MRSPLLAGIFSVSVLLCGPSCAAQPANLTLPQTLAHNCQCLARGRTYAQGEIACIDGRRLQCAMSQNVSSWNPLEGQCRAEDLNASLMPPGLRRPLAGPFRGQTLSLTPM